MIAASSRLCASALIFLVATAHAGPRTLPWVVSQTQPAPADWTVMRGDTLHLEPAFPAAIASPADSAAQMYYQTNGMGDAWWSAPAIVLTNAPLRVRAIWGPTNDCGAARYTFFISISSPAGISYSAHGRLIMQHAPGMIPALLAAPTTLTDAMQAWADARYDPAGAAQTVSNALASGAALGATALQPSWAATGHVDTAGYAEAATSAFSADWAAEATFAHDAGRAIALDSDSADGLALAAATAHTNSPAAHPDIRAAIDAIPLPPTNAVVGWLVWDEGSNVYWRVTATNLRFYVWGVSE